MSITLVSSPDPYALTKGGRTLFRFSGSGRYASTGVKAVSSLIIKAPVPAGTKMVLRWNGKAITLTARTSPGLATEFPAGDGSSVYANTLADYFRSYFPIRADFTVSRLDFGAQPLIIFSARQAGAAYTISLDVAGSPLDLGVNPAGADPVRRVQYSVYCELYLQKPGTAGDDLEADYELVFSPAIECDGEGNAQFDAGSVLHDALTADFPLWSAASAQLSVHSARKYYLAYGEAYGSPLAVGLMQTDQVRCILLGGVDYLHKSGGGLNLLAQQMNDPATDTALRLGPTTRIVRPDEPQYLTFLNARTDRTGSALLIIITFDDDSQLVMNDLLAQPVDVAAGQKVTWAVGALQQNLLHDLPDGRTVKEYTVQWVGSVLGTNPLSVVYRYILNYDYQPYTRYFAYLNSLGAIDTLATFGKGSSELNRFYEQAERYLPALYEVADGQFVDYDVRIQQSVEVATGFRSQTELRSWNDFYRSAYRFRLISNDARPVSITSKSIKQTKDGDSLFAHVFAYIYLFQDDFYSEETITTESMLPPGFVGGGGTIIVPVTTVLYAVDNTVPNAVRELTSQDIALFRTVAARPNPESLGFLDQTTGTTLFRPREEPVPYSELEGKPTTRDEAGLTDVPTVADIFKTIFIKPHLSSWTGEEIPPEIV